MLPVLDNEQMREADRHTIADLGVPGIVLMENAATGVVDAIRERFGDARRVLVLCGGGNNGGDGLAVARHLHTSGVLVSAILCATPQRLSPDAATNLKLVRSFGVPLTVMPDDDVTTLREQLHSEPPDLVVDALLGTGLDRPLAGRFASIVELVDQLSSPLVAVDVPTGLSGSTAQIPGPHLSADLTVTFAAMKLCHALPPACFACGEVVVVDIGIPQAALEQSCRSWWIQAHDVALQLPERPPGGHKGHFGHLAVVAGALGRGGAVAMAARAAVVTGSGLVTMVVPDPVAPVVDLACLEAMTHPLAADARGCFVNPNGLSPLLQRVTAVAVGPGMGTDVGAGAVLELVLGEFDGPVLLDADAVNLLAGKPERLSKRAHPCVLTPHPGELGRLLDLPTAEVVADRAAAARDAAKRTGGVVVAKGFHSIIADPDGSIWINPTGDAHLASGGSGDVLTGTIGSLLAQGLDPVRASIVGTWLHGRAGELGAESYPAAVPASTLPELVATAWRELQAHAMDQ